MRKLALILMVAIACVACTKKAENQNALAETSVEQTTISNDTTEQIYMVVEQMPEFPGGMGELMTYLGENIKYPSKAKENQWEGRTICQFVVEKDGSISDVEVVRSVHPSLDAESVRVVKLMSGKWTPATEREKPVRSKFTLPFVFKPLKKSDVEAE